MRANGADHADALWIAEGLSKTAACPRCEHRGRGTVLAAALWDGFTRGFAIFVVLAVVAGVIGAGFLGSSLAATAGLTMAFAVAASRGVAKARATLRNVHEDASERVFWFFCAECKKGIDDAGEPWMTCERCARAVHEPCAMAHAAGHTALTAYRGSSTSA